MLYTYASIISAKYTDRDWNENVDGDGDGMRRGDGWIYLAPRRRLGLELENRFNSNGRSYQRGPLRGFDPFRAFGKGGNTEALIQGWLRRRGTWTWHWKSPSRDRDCFALKFPDLCQELSFHPTVSRIVSGWDGPDRSWVHQLVYNRCFNGISLSVRVSCPLHKMGWVFANIYSHIPSSNPAQSTPLVLD